MSTKAEQYADRATGEAQEARELLGVGLAAEALVHAGLAQAWATLALWADTGRPRPLPEPTT